MTESTMIKELEKCLEKHKLGAILDAIIDEHGLRAVLEEIADICDDNAVNDVDMTLEWTHTADELRELTTLMEL